MENLNKKNRTKEILSKLKTRKISLYRVSKETKISKMTLGRWKMGASEPSDNLFDVLLNYYNHVFSEGINSNFTNSDDKNLSNLSDIFDFFEQNNHSVYKISNDINISLLSLYNWKNGKTKPSDDNFNILLDYYKRFLLSGDAVKIIKKSSFDGVVPLSDIKKIRDNFENISASIKAVNSLNTAGVIFSDPDLMQEFYTDLKNFNEAVEVMFLDRHDAI